MVSLPQFPFRFSCRNEHPPWDRLSVASAAQEPAGWESTSLLRAGAHLGGNPGLSLPLPHAEIAGTGPRASGLPFSFSAPSSPPQADISHLIPRPGRTVRLFRKNYGLSPGCTQAASIAQEKILQCYLLVLFNKTLVSQHFYLTIGNLRPVIMQQL